MTLSFSALLFAVSGPAQAQQSADLSACQRSAIPAVAINACGRIIDDPRAGKSALVAAYAARAGAYSRTRQFAEAIQDWTQVIALLPDSPQAYVNRGIAHHAMGKFRDAIDDFDAAIELDPKQGAAYLRRGIAHTELGDQRKAVASFDRAIELAPQSADAFMRRGLAHSSLGEHQRAVEDLSRAVTLDPWRTEAYFLIANAYARLGDQARAAQNYCAALSHGDQRAAGHCKVEKKAEPTPAPAPVRQPAAPSDTREYRDGTGQAELRPEDLFQRVSASVYLVIAITASGGRRQVVQGSAVAVTKFQLLTNCHVVANHDRIFLFKAKSRISAVVTSKDTSSDRCVLTASEELPASVTIRRIESVRQGEAVYAVGGPRALILGADLTITPGLVSAKRRIRNLNLVQTNAPISGGSSGGGLFDRFGNVVGITTFAIRDAQNLNFAIAAEDYALR